MRMFLTKVVLTIVGFALYIAIMSGTALGLLFFGRSSFLPHNIRALFSDRGNVVLVGCLVGSALFLLLIVMNKNILRRLNQDVEVGRKSANESHNV